MTSLLDRFTAPAEPQEPQVMTDRPRSYGVPWWAGVYGLDPALPVDDWDLAAQCAGMACAVLVFGEDAGRDERMFPRKAAPAERMAGWLFEADGEPGRRRRLLALRLACEQAAIAETDRILIDARGLYAACSPGRR